MGVTYGFVANWVTRRVDGRPARVLDYGCGSGEIVGLLRDRGIDAYGCDVFYEAGKSEEGIPSELRPFIQQMQADQIPFADAEFDLVLSTQVFEHVPDMDLALREIARVLKPGGTSFHVFPDHGVWREGHCGIPFLHWFPKGSGLRLYYAALMRALGLGHHKRNMTFMEYARYWCQWIDKWTYYRSRRQIHEAFERMIGKTKHAEEQWLQTRSNRLFWLPVPLQRLLVRKMGGIVLVSVRQVTLTKS